MAVAIIPPPRANKISGGLLLIKGKSVKPLIIQPTKKKVSGLLIKPNLIIMLNSSLLYLLSSLETYVFYKVLKGQPHLKDMVV